MSGTFTDVQDDKGFSQDQVNVISPLQPTFAMSKAVHTPRELPKYVCIEKRPTGYVLPRLSSGSRPRFDVSISWVMQLALPDTTCKALLGSPRAAVPATSLAGAVKVPLSPQVMSFAMDASAFWSLRFTPGAVQLIIWNPGGASTGMTFLEPVLIPSQNGKQRRIWAFHLMVRWLLKALGPTTSPFGQAFVVCEAAVARAWRYLGDCMLHQGFDVVGAQEPEGGVTRQLKQEVQCCNK